MTDHHDLTGFERFDPEHSSQVEATYFQLYPKRPAVIDQIRNARAIDVVVVGGGIHGAAFARLAAFNGLKTILFERDDYAFGTSSRSSKMAHGGLRYLELFDFPQVREGIKARNDLFKTAPHLVHPHRFLIPVYKTQGWYQAKLEVGLRLYDLFSGTREYRHRWIPQDEIATAYPHLSLPNLRGCFSYTDGILNDTRLVIENIIAARQEGALCINHAEVVSVAESTEEGERVKVGWRDMLTGTNYSLETGIVVNCAGPWVPWMGRIRASELAQRVRFSRGVHLLFHQSWNAPPLFLPLAGRARYYWIWPHFAGTMVGTTEHEVSEIPHDPEPTRDEVDEILARIAKDIPHSGLDRSSLHYAFAGIRTLPLRRHATNSAQLSRKHLWHYQSGMLSLLGGKLTTAAWTAYEGLRMVYRLAHLKNSPASLHGRPLPGAAGLEHVRTDFLTRCKKEGVPQDVAEQTIGRLGARVKYFDQLPDAFRIVGGTLLLGELIMALEVEQAETLEDVMRRRTDQEYFAHHDSDALNQVSVELKRLRPEIDISAERQRYQERMARLRSVLGVAPS